MGDTDTILSPEDHEHFLTQGYVVVRNAVAPEVIARAVAALEGEDEDPDFDPAAACTTDVVHRAIGELFGPEYGFEKKYAGQDMMRPLQTDVVWAMTAAHVDDAYPTLMPNEWALGTFIFLTPVRSCGGAFVYFAGSPLRYRQGMAASCHAIKEIAQSAEYSGAGAEFLAAPGDVLFFHHLMGHTGSENVADPQTRHALLSRWVPARRVVPGDKPFARMSTIEKANSARYIEHRFAVDLGVRRAPADDGSAALLREGWNSGMGKVRSCALLHFGGRAQWLAVAESEPTRIRRWESEDCVNWRAAEPLALATDEVRGLQLHQYGFDAVLGVTGADDSARIFSSVDFERWDEIASLDGCRATTPWYIYAQYPSKIAGEQALYMVPAADPSNAVCRWGGDWPDAAGGAEQSVAVRAPTGYRIDDLVIAARYSDSHCAFVADVGCAEGGPTAPYYILPRDVAVAEGELQPLAYEGTTPPRRVRVFNRAAWYWMVTYLCGEDDRLFWGCIDWKEASPILRPLTDPGAFDRAKSIVGMI